MKQPSQCPRGQAAPVAPPVGAEQASRPGRSGRPQQAAGGGGQGQRGKHAQQRCDTRRRRLPRGCADPRKGNRSPVLSSSDGARAGVRETRHDLGWSRPRLAACEGTGGMQPTAAEPSCTGKASTRTAAANDRPTSSCNPRYRTHHGAIVLHYQTHQEAGGFRLQDALHSAAQQPAVGNNPKRGAAGAGGRWRLCSGDAAAAVCCRGSCRRGALSRSSTRRWQQLRHQPEWSVLCRPTPLLHNIAAARGAGRWASCQRGACQCAEISSGMQRYARYAPHLRVQQPPAERAALRPGAGQQPGALADPGPPLQGQRQQREHSMSAQPPRV